MALNGLFCADVLLRNYSLTHWDPLISNLLIWRYQFLSKFLRLPIWTYHCPLRKRT